MNTEKVLKDKTGKWVALVTTALMLLAACAVPVVGQGNVDTEGFYTGGPGGFEGMVKDIVTDMPVSGIFVQVFNDTGGAEEGNGTTALDGMYGVPEGDNGVYDIQFTHDDYHMFLVEDKAVIFGDTYSLNVSLEPVNSTVDGVVYDSLTMQPLEGLWVNLTMDNGIPVQDTYTDGSGAYNFSTQLRDFRIKVDWPGYDAYLSDVQALAINSSAIYDVNLVRSNYDVMGQVTGSGGLEGAKVMLNGIVDLSTTTNETGHYSVSVPWGTYGMAVSYDGYYLFETTVDVVDMAVTQDVSMWSMPMQTAEVFGYVKGNDTKGPIPGAWVCFADHEAGGKVCKDTGVDGYFHFDIYTAYFEMTVSKDGYIGRSTFVSISKDESKNLGDILLEPTPPMDKKVSGTVNVAGATVTFYDSGVMVSDALSNATGYYELMVYDGTFDAKVTASGYFPLQVVGIVVATDMTKDFVLVAMPAKDLNIYGYVKDMDGNPIADASVVLVDKAADHGGFPTPPELTTPGGYYSFSIYAGTFLLIVDAEGFNADLFTVVIADNMSKDIVLEDSVQLSMGTMVTFDNWDNITIKMVMDRGNDVQLLRYTIDNRYGDNNGNVTQAEVDAWLQVEKDMGPESKDTEDVMDVDGTVYIIVDGTFEVMADGATGLITGDDPVTVTHKADYVAEMAIEEAEVHFITYNVTFDDETTDNLVTITVPEGWESRNATAEHVAVEGTFEIALDPPMQEPGLEWEHAILNVTGNSPPVANAGKNRTIKVDINETFDGSGSEDDFGIFNYSWDFGDGEMGYGEEVVHKFGLPTSKDQFNYTVTLTVEDTAGVVNVTSIWVIVDGAPPVAKFDANKTTADEDGDYIEFNASSAGSTDNVGVFNYTWDFDDGRFGYGATVNHTWTQPGKYNVTLNITDEAGWWANATNTVTIKDVTDPRAKVDYEGPSDRRVFIDDKDVLVFNGSRSTDNVEVVMFKWDFGDGATIEGADKEEVNHTYTTEGEFNVTLTVSDAAGNSNTSDPIIIKSQEKPKIPDLEITSIKITPDGFRDGDTVTIKVKVKNNGDGDIGPSSANEDFTIQFSYGKHKIKIKRGLTVAGHSETTVSVDWKAKEGNYKVCAEADWDNKIGEVDENNNKRCSEKFEVGMGWQNIGLIVGLVLVLVVLVVLAGWRSKVAKKERKERLRKRKKR